jgi:hypothetical protein
VLELLADQGAGRRLVQDGVDGRARDEPGEEGAGRVGELVALRGDLGDLARGGDPATARGQAQRLDVARDAVRERVEPRGDVLPGLDAVGRHEVEDLAHLLRGGRDDVERAQQLVRGVELELQADPLAHHRQGDLVDGVGCGLLVQLGEHSPRGLGAGGVARGGVVRHLVVVAGDAHERRAQRVQGRDRVDVPLRDRVDRAR